MMSESKQEETAVSVVQASPDVRPVLLPSPLVRISLRSLQAMPGYTSSPVLEDGAGIVAYDTVNGEDFLVVNAYKAGTQYRFGGGQDFKLYAFCGRELQEVVAPGWWGWGRWCLLATRRYLAVSMRKRNAHCLCLCQSAARTCIHALTVHLAPLAYALPQAKIPDRCGFYH